MLPLKDTLPARSFPLVKWLLVAANVVLFLVELSLGRMPIRSLPRWASCRRASCLPSRSPMPSKSIRRRDRLGATL